MSGAYLKASHVPRPGTLLLLIERFNADGADIALRGEVMWTQDEASLERPETGFGLRFIELSTRADPGYLEDFLKGLEPNRPVPAIVFEERATGAHAVYRFPPMDLDPGLYKEDEAGFGELDEPIVVDLNRELERLTLEDSQSGTSASPATLAAPPSLATSPGQAEAPKAAPSPAKASRRPRSHKRSVTGIFTALFTRGPRLDDLSDLSAEVSEATPALGEGTLVHDTRRPKILLSWASGGVVARIESLQRQGATLWTSDAAPERGQEVTLQPVGAAPRFELAIVARVEARDDRKKSGVSWLSLTFVKVDEHGHAGRFQEYLRLINGPGADER